MYDDFSLKEERRAAGFLRVQEVADLVGVSPETIVRWSRAGKMPSMIKMGWNYFLASEIADWVATLKEAAH